jgi:2-polyprenyl-3-methyl-5-hydroxy-6-metoxy-1,4-benzoquinol methylase
MTYEEIQKVKYRSFESQNARWAEGQERCIKEWVVPHIKPPGGSVPRFNNPYDGPVILDCACGDGVGLTVFSRLGYNNVVGIEFEHEKAQRARLSGNYPNYPVHEKDMHDPALKKVREVFDVVYSSHSLEHAHDPVTVLDNFYHMLKPGGLLFLILPYPDAGPDDAHCGKYVLGTGAGEGASLGTLWDILVGVGFTVLEHKLDTWREPEVWVRARRD